MKRKRLIGPLMAVVVLGALLAWVWEERLEDRLVTKRWGTVEPGLLYRSGYLAPVFAESILRKHSIRVIVDLAEIDPDHPSQRAELAAARALGITRFKLPLIGDGTGNPDYYVGALTQAHRAVEDGQPVLLHCAAGSQRSGAAIALYRLLLQNAPADEVIAELKRFGWKPGKDAILLDYLNANIPRIAQGLVENGVLAAVPEPLPALSVESAGN